MTRFNKCDPAMPLTILCTVITQPMQVQLSYIACTEAPVKMSARLAIAINGKLYYGGGGCYIDDNKYYIHCFNPLQNVWSTLPRLSVWYFGLGEVRGELVTVGGTDTEREYTPTSKIYVYGEASKTWKQTIPHMPTYCKTFTSSC